MDPQTLGNIVKYLLILNDELHRLYPGGVIPDATPEQMEELRRMSHRLISADHQDQHDAFADIMSLIAPQQEGK